MVVVRESEAEQAPHADAAQTSATVQVVDQAIVVLKAICENVQPRGVRELSRDLDISKSAVQRIVTSLERAGLVVFEESTRKYVVGPGVLTLAWRYSSHSDLVSASSGIADAFAASSGETVSVSTIVGSNRVTVYEAESPLPFRFTTGVGRPHSLLIGATSRVLLGLLPQDERRALLSTVEPQADQLPFDFEGFEAEIDEVIKDGHAISRGEWIEGTVGFSAPIGRSGQMVATLSIYGPATRLTEERIAELLPGLGDRARAIASRWRDG